MNTSNEQLADILHIFCEYTQHLTRGELMQWKQSVTTHTHTHTHR